MAQRRMLTKEVLEQAVRDYLEDNNYADVVEVVEDMMLRALTDELVEALDGCAVEPDGICPHGYPSWLAYAGMF